MTLRDFYNKKEHYRSQWHFYSKVAIDCEYGNPQKAKEYKELSEIYYNKYLKIHKFEQKTLENALKGIDNNRF